MFPSGALPISAATADDGAPVLQLRAPGVSPSQSFISRRWTDAKRRLHEQVAYFAAPGKGDRALQLLYHQLPYHPQRIDAHTARSFELTAPVELATTPMVASDPPAPGAPTPGKSEIWSVNATLMRGLTSATARPGDPVEAQVVEPVYDHDKQLVVPQDSTLVGKVSIATAAKSFGEELGKFLMSLVGLYCPLRNGPAMLHRMRAVMLQYAPFRRLTFGWSCERLMRSFI